MHPRSPRLLRPTVHRGLCLQRLSKSIRSPQLPSTYQALLSAYAVTSPGATHGVTTYPHPHTRTTPLLSTHIRTLVSRRRISMRRSRSLTCGTGGILEWPRSPRAPDKSGPAHSVEVGDPRGMSVGVARVVSSVAQVFGLRFAEDWGLDVLRFDRAVIICAVRLRRRTALNIFCRIGIFDQLHLERSEYIFTRHHIRLRRQQDQPGRLRG